jgi:hypothetical protein
LSPAFSGKSLKFITFKHLVYCMHHLL